MTPTDVVARYVNAVAAGDLDTIVDSFADDATWTYPGNLPLSGTWRGRDAIINDFLGGATAGLFRPGNPPEITLTNILAEDDQVVAEWTARGVTAHGHTYDNRCLGVFRVRADKITSVREYADTDHAARTLFA